MTVYKALFNRRYLAVACVSIGLISACAGTPTTANPTKPEPPVAPTIAQTQITIEHYRAANGEKVNVTYDTGKKPPTVHLSFDGKSMTLKQTTAWAKGAIYEGEGLIWEAQGDTARLTRAGKRIVFSIEK